MGHLERERVITEVEERLDLDPDLLAPRFLKVSVPFAHPVVPVIGGASDSCKYRVDFDVRVAERDECPYIARVERFYEAASPLDILL